MAATPTTSAAGRAGRSAIASGRVALAAMAIAFGAPGARAAEAPRAPDIAGAWTVTGEERGLGGFEGRVVIAEDGSDDAGADAGAAAPETRVFSARGEYRFADGATHAASGTARAWPDGRIEVALTLSRRAASGGLTGALEGAGANDRAPSRRAGLASWRLSRDGLRTGGEVAPAPAGGASGRSGRESWRRADADGTVVLKVMSFNIKGFTGDWFSRLRGIAKLVREEKPDVIGLQEVEALGRERLSQAALLGRMTGYDAAYRGASSRIGFPFRWLWHGNAILARGDIGHVDSILLAQPGREDRNAMFARVEVRDGVRVNFFTTHLQPRVGEPYDTVRREQLRDVLGWIARFRDRPLIVTGDFNARPDSGTYAMLTGARAHRGTKASFTDAWALAGEGGTGASFGRADGPVRIDYVFIDPDPDRPGGGARVLRSWLRGDPASDGREEWLSDHRALFATVEIDRPRR